MNFVVIMLWSYCQYEIQIRRSYEDGLRGVACLSPALSFVVEVQTKLQDGAGNRSVKFVVVVHDADVMAC